MIRLGGWCSKAHDVVTTTNGKGHPLTLEVAVGLEDNVSRRVITLLVPDSQPSMCSWFTGDLHGIGSITSNVL